MQKKDSVASHTTTRPKPAYDWKKIRDEYLSSGVALRELARKYGMSQATIMRKSKKEGWIAQREHIDSRSMEKTAEKIADGRADINAKAMECIQIIMDKALEGAKTIGMDSKSLKDYVSILKDLRDIGAISIETKSSEITVVFEDGDDYGD